MSATSKDVILRTVLADLKSKYPQWQIKDHFKIEWMGHPSDTWPEADIVINTPGRRFVINYDEDSDPGRSLTKYWPILHEPFDIPLTIIQVWKRGIAIGDAFAILAKWMGIRLMKLYPGTIHEFIEITHESVEVIAQKISYMIVGMDYFTEDETPLQ